jgi:RNA polymerase sigma-70 factor (ECF subfamily)
VTIPQPDPAAEERLVARLRAGEQEAFAEFVRLHGARMLAVARRFLGNEEDARDAVQDAFLSAFRGLGGFEGGARLSTWLHRIVVNAALMKLRTRRRKPETPIDDLLPGFLEDGHLERPAVPWRRTDDEAERNDLRALVQEKIRELPEGYRNVLLLRDIEGLDTGETAQLMDLSEGAVKTRLHRARLALRELLEPHLRRMDT